jgi:hypothetical protein
MRRVAYASEVSGPPSAGGEWRPRLIVPGHNSETYEWLDQTRQMFARANGGFATSTTRTPRSDAMCMNPLPSAGGSGSSRRPTTGRPGAGWAAPSNGRPWLRGRYFCCFWGREPRFSSPAGLACSQPRSFPRDLLPCSPLQANSFPGLLDYRGFAQGFALWSVLPFWPPARGTRARTGADRRAALVLCGGSRGWSRTVGQRHLRGPDPRWNRPRRSPGLLGCPVRSRAGRAAPLVPLPWRAWATRRLGDLPFRLFCRVFPFAHGLVGPPFHSPRVWHRLARRRRNPCTADGVDTGRNAAMGFQERGDLGALLMCPGLRTGHDVANAQPGIPGGGPASMRLSQLPEAEMAPNLWAWLLRNGFTPAVWATFLPLVLIVPALGVLVLRSFGLKALRARACARSCGCRPGVLPAPNHLVERFGFYAPAASCRNGGLPEGTPRPRIVVLDVGCPCGLGPVPGAVRLWPSTGPKDELTKNRGRGSRRARLWPIDLAKHAGMQGAIDPGASRARPPRSTTTGESGDLGPSTGRVGDGLQIAMRIASASTPEEAQELIGLRGVTHIIIPAVGSLHGYVYAQHG